jgi:hypothetical protein
MNITQQANLEAGQHIRIVNITIIGNETLARFTPAFKIALDCCENAE